MTDHHHQVVVQEEGVGHGKELEWEEGEFSWNGKDLTELSL